MTRKIFTLFAFLISINSHASLFELIGTCRNHKYKNEVPLRVLQSLEDNSDGLIAFEILDPESNLPFVATEEISLKKNGHKAYHVLFKENSVFRQVTDTIGFDISNFGGSKWIGKYQTHTCILDETLDKKELFENAKMSGNSIVDGPIETASLGSYSCSKTTISFTTGITGRRMDPIKLYKCYYDTTLN